MEKDKKAPFPQANDFEKVKTLITIQDEAYLLSDKLIAATLGGIAERQSRYYLAAARYLGVVNEKRQFTDLGNKLRELDEFMLKAELIRLIISVPVIGRVYILEKLLDMNKSDVSEIIEQEYPEYTDVIRYRRAQTVLSWISWVKQNMEE